MNRHRRENVALIRSAFAAHPAWRGQLLFPQATADLEACWFGFPFLVDESVRLDYRGYTRALNEQGIDTRPIVSGNMALQPAVKHFPVELGMGPFTGAQRVHDRGLFIGCHARPIQPGVIEHLVDLMLRSLAEHSR
jgi:CDP-6-deoxy-D-xylo-4-hexulose-3-dehydrase